MTTSFVIAPNYKPQLCLPMRDQLNKLWPTHASGGMPLINRREKENADPWDNVEGDAPETDALNGFSNKAFLKNLTF